MSLKKWWKKQAARNTNTTSLTGDVLPPSRNEEGDDLDEVEYVEQEKRRLVTGEMPMDWWEL